VSAAAADVQESTLSSQSAPIESFGKDSRDQENSTIPTLLRSQEAKLAEQDAKLAEQDAKLSEQDAKLSAMANLLSEHEAKLQGAVW
jgi:hypothetical protein